VSRCIGKSGQSTGWLSTAATGRGTHPHELEVKSLVPVALVTRSGRRQSTPYSPVPDSDHALIEPRLRRRTPSAWMIPFGDRRRPHNSTALDGSMTLHLVAA
jgi:hypothetical protein